MNVIMENTVVSEFRGRVRVDGIIDLPEEWNGKSDPDKLIVQLTPNTCYQELFVESMPYGRTVKVRNQSGGMIDAFFTVTAILTVDD
jgi:hypothetical protein|tara:strand:- start:156 stop:416 length:261 start_codon:yes stop_codon:yes gene_type:complete